MAPRGKKRGAKSAAVSTATKRGKSKGDEEEPPSKLQREESLNTKLRRAINDTKNAQPKKKTFKPDSVLANNVPNVPILEDYSCMLNQTNIGQNNNKFYVIQVAADATRFICFTRWGRVGEQGADKIDYFTDEEGAIAAFKKKFKDKTGNDWDKRDNFTPKPKKYTMLEIDEESSDEDEPDSKLEVVKSLTPFKGKCTLDGRTQLMIRLIFNDDMFVNQMSSMNLDVRKMPLGKLSKTQIAKGLEVLLDIEKAIQDGASNSVLSTLSSKFYTLVPHSFGRSVPPVISQQSIVDQKKELMMTLSDIELTQSLQKEKVEGESVHPLDEKYGKLDCVLEYVDKKSDEFYLIESYYKACPPSRSGALLDVWKVNRKSEESRFKVHDDISYRKLLWHGTNVAVVAAILKAGLRIMPHSGGRVGRGIYFASEYSKSAGYVGINYGAFEEENNVGFMFLTEVALGNMKFIDKDDHTLKSAPKGFESVVARGWTEPDPKKDKKLKIENHDVIVPIGKPVVQKEYKNSSAFAQSEYLVYRESQARIRYLLKFSFTW